MVIYNHSKARAKEKEIIKMKKMLMYYGFETLEDFGKAHGFYNNVDAERLLVEMYEEDILWD